MFHVSLRLPYEKHMPILDPFYTYFGYSFPQLFVFSFQYFSGTFFSNKKICNKMLKSVSQNFCNLTLKWN